MRKNIRFCFHVWKFNILFSFLPFLWWASFWFGNKMKVVYTHCLMFFGLYYLRKWLIVAIIVSTLPHCIYMASFEISGFVRVGARLNVGI